MKVRDCDEGDLIARFVNVLPQGERTIVGSGDDCALISCPEPSFLVTTDTLVGESHFLKAWSTGAEIGARAAAQNLADIAAMGGRTSALVVSLVLRGDYDVDWLVDMVQAFGQRAREAGAGVVGGDLTGGEELIISRTTHLRSGHTLAGKPLHHTLVGCLTGHRVRTRKLGHPRTPLTRMGGCHDEL